MPTPRGSTPPTDAAKEKGGNWRALVRDMLKSFRYSPRAAARSSSGKEEGQAMLTPDAAKETCSRCGHAWTLHAGPDEIAGCRLITHGMRSATLCNCLERRPC
jgi:hypothetical protein